MTSLPETRDSLKAEVERRMLALCPFRDATGEDAIAVKDAVAVAVEMIKKASHPKPCLDADTPGEHSHAIICSCCMEREEKRAEAAEKRWNEHYTDCHMNSNRLLREAAEAAFRQATKDREVAEAGREAAEKERESVTLEPHGVPGPYPNCTDCGRPMVWDSLAHRRWMCPACLYRRAEAAEKERDEARKALAEFRSKWRHAAGCGCRPGFHNSDCVSKKNRAIPCGEPHAPVCDPRCAPAPGAARGGG